LAKGADAIGGRQSPWGESKTTALMMTEEFRGLFARWGNEKGMRGYECHVRRETLKVTNITSNTRGRSGSLGMEGKHLIVKPLLLRNYRNILATLSRL